MPTSRSRITTAEVEDDEEPAGAGPREELDLVRVYLQHIGKRKLLKAHQEREIGERIENAQRELVGALADIPGAVQTLVALADRIRLKGDPAAELILLPEGGELQDEHVAPVLKAFGRVKRHRSVIDNLREKLDNPRTAVKTRARLEQQLERARKSLAAELAAQPIRPSLIDDVATELREFNEAFHGLEAVPRTERAERCRALEIRVGLPRAEFRRRYRRGRERRRHGARRQARPDGSEPPPGRLDCQRYLIAASPSWTSSRRATSG